MASRKPDLKIPLPDRVQAEAQSSPSPLRSPRFIEDFDAPFSEALMNASRTTLATDSNSYPSNSRASFGAESCRRPSFGNAVKAAPQQAPSPVRFQDPSWESEAKRRSTINDRIMEWAKKSWTAVRPRPGSKNDDASDAERDRRKSSAILPSSPSAASATDVSVSQRPNRYSQPVVSIDQVPDPRRQ